MKLKALFLIIVMTLVASSLAACGGKRAKDDSQVKVQETASSDITSPPNVAKDVFEPEEETNAGDTISYDEWRRKREAQLNAASIDDSEEDSEDEE